MKLLLKEDVENLGSVGDEVSVKDGYARNYLVPRGKAIVATHKSMKQFNHQKSVVERKVKKLRKSAEALAEQIAATACVFEKKVGEQGKLFGSVTAQEIADKLKENGVEVDRRKIQMIPIKSLGEFQVPLKLQAHVVAQINVTVVAEKEEEPKTEAKEEAKPTENA